MASTWLRHLVFDVWPHFLFCVTRWLIYTWTVVVGGFWVFGDGGGDLCLLLAVYTLPRHNPDGLICCAKLLLSGVKLLHATSVHCSWSAWTCIASHCIDLNHTFALQYCPAHCLSVHFAKPPLLNIGVEPICESGTFEKLTLTLRKLKWSKPNVSLEKRKYSSGQRWSYRRSSCKT